MSNSREISLQVLRVKQPIGEFYISSIRAKDLVEISYNDVRRLAEDQRDFEKYLGIQRPVSQKRIKEIKNYIDGKDATFPTAVILAVDGRCAEFDEGSSRLVLKSYQPEPESEDDEIPFEKIAKVIDGQHRIAAFMNDNEGWSFDFNDDFDINVSIFVGADISEQASIFATVNLAQTKVNKSLVYDLTELAKTRSPHKTCHNVAVVLDSEASSPLYKRIKRLGTATPGRIKEPLTQASFVESLVKFISVDPVTDRNLLLDGRELKLTTKDNLNKTPFRELFIRGNDLEIAEILYNYFSAVRRKWPNSWGNLDKVGNLLPKSNAFKALMKFLLEDVYVKSALHIGDVPSEDDFYKFFENIDFDDESFTTKEFLPGSGGQSAFLKMLRGQLSLDNMIKAAE